MKKYLLEVMTPARRFFRGEVESVKFNGSSGELSVLHGHTSMLVTLNLGELRIQVDDKQTLMAVHSQGFAEVNPHQLILFVQYCEWPEEIDLAHEQHKLELIQEKLRQKQSIIEHKQTEITLARTMMRLRIKRGR